MMRSKELKELITITENLGIDERNPGYQKVTHSILITNM